MNADRIIKSAEDVARQLCRDEGEERARLAHEVGMLRGHIRGLCASLERYTNPFDNLDQGQWTGLLYWDDVPVMCLMDEDDFIVGCGINGEVVFFDDMPERAQRVLEEQLSALVIRTNEKAQAEAYAATL